MRRFTSADANRCVDSGRPTRIAVSIHVGRRESLRRFWSAGSNVCVDSGRSPRIAVSIQASWLDSRRPTRAVASNQVGRFRSLCRFTSANSNRCVDSGRRAGRLESPWRFGSAESMSAASDRYVLSARITWSILVGLGRLIHIAVSIRAGRLESVSRFRSADSDRYVDSGRAPRRPPKIHRGRPEPKGPIYHLPFAQPRRPYLINYGPHIPDLFPGVGLR